MIGERSLETYLGETLGLKISTTSWGEERTLPHGMKQAYRFKVVEILDTKFLLLEQLEPLERSIRQMDKHAQLLLKRFDLRVIFHLQAIESYQRRELIKKKLPFIVSDQQFYLPDLGIDLKERMKVIRPLKKHLSPYAQVLVISSLLGRPEIDHWTATSLSRAFGVTKMTMSRAIDELVSFELVQVEGQGREKHLHFEFRGRQLLDRCWKIMRSPVQKRIYMEGIEDTGGGLIAGESALSKKTMITEPKARVLAFPKYLWSKIEKNEIHTVFPESSRDMASHEIEVWRYDPHIFATNGMVDPVSLFLSLQDTNDERVLGEMEKLKDEFAW